LSFVEKWWPIGEWQLDGVVLTIGMASVVQDAAAHG
jgi:hypothetical protein